LYEAFERINERKKERKKEKHSPKGQVFLPLLNLHGLTHAQAVVRTTICQSIYLPIYPFASLSIGLACLV